MYKLPPQLQHPEFRYTRIPKHKKRPMDRKWWENAWKLDDDEFQEHLEKGGDYGIATGYGNLTVIDADVNGLMEEVEKNLPETFTVKTGSGGRHFYYFCPDLNGAIRLKDNTAGDVGDIQHKGKHVVGPGSKHPNGNYYKLVNDVEIAEVKAENIKFALRKWLKVRQENGKENNVSIEDVVDLKKLKKSEDEYYGAHPIHGSGQRDPRNFWINPDKNVWHCFRHDSGGGPLLLLAVKYGIIDCSDAGPGALKKKKYVEVIERADKEGILNAENYLETNERPYFEDGKFVPKNLAEDIMKDHQFVTMEESEELYIYCNGVYRPGGGATVKSEAQKRLSGDSKNQRINEVVGHVKRSNYRPAEDFGGDKTLLAVKNGILNLKTRELKPHTSEKLLLTKLPVKYDPNAKCPKIEKFINSLVAGENDVKKIQEMIGYTLLRENPLNKSFMGLGPGANGRSTLFDLFHSFLGGENTASVDLADLVYDKFASADLFGKLANFCADISNRMIKHSGRFKKLVGEDIMRAQKKHQDAFKFKCYATPWFSANELPETKDKTRAFYRRWIILNFPYIFTSDPKELEKEGFKEKDPKLPDPLKTDEEMAGLLNWALDGLDRILENKKFSNERTVTEKRKLWELESDPVLEFLDEWCIEDKGVEIPKDVIRQAYRKFCEENNYNVLSSGPLTKRLKTHGVGISKPRTEDGRVQCYRGYVLAPEIIKEKELVQVVEPFSFLLNYYEENYSLDSSIVKNKKHNTLDHADQLSLKNSEIDSKQKNTSDARGSLDSDKTGLSQEEISKKLGDLLFAEQPKIRELPQHFDEEDLPRVNEMLLRWRESGRARLTEERRWVLND